MLGTGDSALSFPSGVPLSRIHTLHNASGFRADMQDGHRLGFASPFDIFKPPCSQILRTRILLSSYCLPYRFLSLSEININGLHFQ